MTWIRNDPHARPANERSPPPFPGELDLGGAPRQEGRHRQTRRRQRFHGFHRSGTGGLGRRTLAPEKLLELVLLRLGCPCHGGAKIEHEKKIMKARRLVETPGLNKPDPRPLNPYPSPARGRQIEVHGEGVDFFQQTILLYP